LSTQRQDGENADTSAIARAWNLALNKAIKKTGPDRSKDSPRRWRRPRGRVL